MVEGSGVIAIRSGVNLGGHLISFRSLEFGPPQHHCGPHAPPALGLAAMATQAKTRQRLCEGAPLKGSGPDPYRESSASPPMAQHPQEKGRSGHRAQAEENPLSRIAGSGMQRSHSE